MTTERRIKQNYREMTDNEFYARIEDYQERGYELASADALMLMIQRNDAILCLSCEAVVIVSVKAAKVGRFQCGACYEVIDLRESEIACANETTWREGKESRRIKAADSFLATFQGVIVFTGNKHHVKDFAGIAIYLDAEGKFTAEIGRKLVVKPSLREIEKEIGKHGTGVKTFAQDKIYGKTILDVKEHNLIDYAGEKFIDDKRVKHASYESFYFWDADLFMKLRDLYERYEKAMDEFEAEQDRLIEQAKVVGKDYFKNRSTSQNGSATG